MYLSKQWRESRIISGIAVLVLALLFLLAVKGSIEIRSTHISADNQYQFGAVFIPIFYVEAGLIAFWGWLAGGIGAGKNLGEESGSFLFTRPRRRAWFLWHDWGFAMAQITIIVLLVNLIVGFLLARFLTIVHLSSDVQLTAQSTPSLCSCSCCSSVSGLYSLPDSSTVSLISAPSSSGAPAESCWLQVYSSHTWSSAD